MSLTRERIYFLLEQYTEGRISQEEEKELMEWIAEGETNIELRDFMLKIWENRNINNKSVVDWEEMYRSITTVQEPRSSFGLSSRISAAIVVAAASLIMIFVLVIPMVKQGHEIGVAEKSYSDDLKNAAFITLSSQEVLRLQQREPGILGQEGDVTISLASPGFIRYAGGHADSKLINSLTVPVGSDPVIIQLDDGSKIWVNVGTTITFPVKFEPNERRMSMDGEIYAEITSNKHRPFILESGDINVRVTGTRFNANTYHDEPCASVTLLEGSVQVSHESHSALLEPGQQASYDKGNKKGIAVSEDIDTGEVVSWKSREFRFNMQTDIQTVMRQIARRYACDVEYKDEIHKHYWGTISRDLPLHQVLAILEATGDIKFRLQKNKIIVMKSPE